MVLYKKEETKKKPFRYYPLGFSDNAPSDTILLSFLFDACTADLRKFIESYFIEPSVCGFISTNKFEKKNHPPEPNI